MDSNLKKIKIGSLIKRRAEEIGFDNSRILKLLKITETELEEIFQSDVILTDMLLKLSKLLEYDFFRIYCQHLMLYSPPSYLKKSTKLPQFRKNVYTKEIVDFVLEQIENNIKTRQQVIEEYRIPKATLYKWLSKYGKNQTD